MPTSSPAQKTLQRVYGAMAAMTVMTFVPLMGVAILAGLLFIGILIALYMIKARSDEDSVIENHMIYLIRTIWITSFILLITIAFASVYLFAKLNYDAILPCADNLLARVNAGASSIATLTNLIMPCTDQFIADNMPALMMATAMAGGPVIIYFLYRLFQGGSRGIKGYRVANPKSWW